MADNVPEKAEDLYYRLTANVKLASAGEASEILAAVESLSDEDMAISSTRKQKLFR